MILGYAVVAPARGGSSGRGVEVYLSAKKEVVHLSAEVDGEDAKWICAPRRGQGPLTYPSALVAPGCAPTKFSSFLSQSKEEYEKSH